MLGKYHDPETLISFATYNPETKIGIRPEMLEKLKAEACKTPVKPGDTIRFYTKEELRKGILMPDGSRVSIPSPNLWDAVVTSLDKASIINPTEEIDLNSIYQSTVSHW